MKTLKKFFASIGNLLQLSSVFIRELSIIGGVVSMIILGWSVFAFGLYIGSSDGDPGDLLRWIKQPGVVVSLLALSISVFIFRGTRSKLWIKFENSRVLRWFEAL
ncbi:MAG: hypothetical protein WC456_00565 [Patescibacteria group bacterium]